jgi:hypothetical protein
MAAKSYNSIPLPDDTIAVTTKEAPEAYLAHSEKTLARVYSNQDFDKLADALGIMETKLAAVFA